MTELSTKALKKYAKEAKEAGVPEDQLQRFINAGYIAYKNMLPFHASARQADRQTGPLDIGLAGTRGPGKSHAVLAQIGLDDCQRKPGLKALYLRKIKRAASESFEDLLFRVFQYVPYNYIPSRNRIEFPNGSRIVIGGFNNDRDIDAYLGIEYDLMAIEEATQLSKDKVQRLTGSRRSSLPGWRARSYYTTNSEGIGYIWFKKKFVIPFREGREKETKTRYFESYYWQNPALKPEYIHYLENLEGDLAKVWAGIDWDYLEGLAFPQFNKKRHVKKIPPLPDWWAEWGGVDWGYANPYCHLWAKKDPNTGRIYIIREVYQAGLSDREQARLIKDKTPRDEKLPFSYADPSMWTKKSKDYEFYSTADEYYKEGVMIIRADNSRIQGKHRIDNLLADLPDGKPGLIIDESCVNLIRQFENIPRDPNNPEDIDTKAEDHSLDALKYLLSNYDNMQAPKKREDSLENEIQKNQLVLLNKLL